MKVSVTIMAHPKRKDKIPALSQRLPDADVVWDRENNRWDTGRRAMLARDPSADWHVVVQDDVILCDDFARHMVNALDYALPEAPVAFYTGKVRPYAEIVSRAVKRATERGMSWIAMKGPLWGPAVAVPTDMIPDMIEACDQIPIDNYDIRMAEYFDQRGILCQYTLPSLVNHRVGSENPSLVPGRSSSMNRVAHSFIRPGTEPDWSTGAYTIGNPARPWKATPDGYVCENCFGNDAVGTDDLATMIRHSVEDHDLGVVDFYATTPDAVRSLSGVAEKLPVDALGTFWLAGAELPDPTFLPTSFIRLRRRSTWSRMRREPDRFTICGRDSDLRYLVESRTAWSLEGEHT